MIGLAAILTGILFAAGIYLILSRNTQRVAIGFIVLANAVNLMFLTSSGVPENAVPPLVVEGIEEMPVADPLPQAFILTAIVIGLGVAAFLLAMASRANEEMKTDELQERDWT
jgi:multicomponent Na+:H+ antiporter subunit C